MEGRWQQKFVDMSSKMSSENTVIICFSWNLNGFELGKKEFKVA